MNTTARPTPAKNYKIEDLQPIIEGKIPVPNVEEMDPAKGLQSLVFSGWKDLGTGRARMDPKSHDTVWARFYAEYVGMGSVSGGGIVVWQSVEHDPEYKTTGRIATFAICKHQFVEGPGANHQRGWHPGYCGKCGLDMSVDSGD